MDGCTESTISEHPQWAVSLQDRGSLAESVRTAPPHQIAEMARRPAMSIARRYVRVDHLRGESGALSMVSSLPSSGSHCTVGGEFID
jgi:hypothetical protein